MFAMRPRHSIGYLHTGLIREGRALQEGGDAQGKSAACAVGDRNRGRQSQRVGITRRGHKIGFFVWRWLLRKLKLKIAAILEADLVGQVRSNEAVEFGH